jgi:MinD-like ATPase involved in chromosome partitioning or flagellar assembly
VAIPVLTAIGDPTVEGTLVAAFDRPTHGITVVRRCVDVADLVAAATVGTSRCAIISSDLRRLDRDVLARLAAAGVAVVALVPDGDEGAERWLRQIGAEHVLPAGATPAEVAEAVTAATAGETSGGLDYADPLSALPTGFRGGAQEDGAFDIAPATGRVIAVWGATGAPGRTTVALTLADELARLDVATLLIDADAYGGALAQALGMLEESPGLAAACRMANTGSLDVPALARLARALTPRLRVLTGITRPDRWPELRPSAVEHVLQMSRRLAACTIVDCGFSLEQDEELAYDTMAPRRNGATLTALAEADLVIAVVAADPIGIQRFIRALPELRDAADCEIAVVVNKLRGVVVPGDAQSEIAAALHRYAGITPVEYVPYDRVACDRALAGGQPLAAASSSSAARAALARLAKSFLARDVAQPAARGRRRAGTATASSGAGRRARSAR